MLVQSVRDISIHAPREGSDTGRSEELYTEKISIHAPREGSDLTFPSIRQNLEYFYPRSPRGERPGCFAVGLLLLPDFYPRSPRGERPFFWAMYLAGRRFLSTLPARGATRVGDRGDLHFGISIHAPREGSDV